MRAQLALVFVLTGCGDASRDDLAGSDWALVDSSATCADTLSFGESGSYAESRGCQAGDVFQLQGEGGGYSTDGDSVTFFPARTSCPAAGAATMRYRVSGASLTLSDQSGAVSLMRVHPDGSVSPGAAVTGCFDDAGVFTAMPVHDL